MSPTSEKLLQKVYRLLSFRDRSEKEIRDFLKKKTENIDEIIEELKEQRFIDDEKFAKAWVESRRRSKKKGAIAIKQELWQKGIDRETIDSIMYQVSSIKGEEEVAEEALEKKLRLWRNLSGMELRKKATDFLMRRGFEYEVAKQVVEKLLKF